MAAQTVNQQEYEPIHVTIIVNQYQSLMMLLLQEKLQEEALRPFPL